MNQKLQEELSRATQFFQIAVKFQDQIETQEEIIFETKNQFQNEKDKKIQFWSIVRFLSIAAFGFSLIVWIATIVTIGGMFFGNPEEMRQGEGAAVVGIFFIACVVMSLIPIIFIVFSTHRIRKRRTDYDLIYKTNIEPQIKVYEAELQRTNDLAEKFVRENNYVIAFLPAQYRNIQAVSFMLVAVTSGRADSLKEVYNLYEEQLHRWKLEDAAMESLQAQEYMVQAMQETNDRLKEIEFIQYLQYLNNKNAD